MQIGKSAAILAAAILVGMFAAPMMTSAQQVDPAAVQKVAADPLLEGADVAHGKEVFARKGVCVSCHGWDGDGLGKNPRSNGIPLPLRESQLDTAGFLETVKCGRPGTGMPFHDSAAYKDDRCYGLTFADFGAGAGPIKGKSLRPQDIKDVVAYLEVAIQGHPKATYEDCAAYFEASADKACAFMKK
jgi:mono/diheme cytochrome c family protein